MRRPGEAPGWRPVLNPMRQQLLERRPSYWRRLPDGEGVTVFETHDGWWKWVYDGDYCDDEFGTPEEAMSAADEELDSP